MNAKTIPFVLALCLLPAVGFAKGARQISIRVVDERDKPVKGARVRARYLASIHEGGQEYRVPLELANPQTTDANGKCRLILQGSLLFMQFRASLIGHRS